MEYKYTCPQCSVHEGGSHASFCHVPCEATLAASEAINAQLEAELAQVRGTLVAVSNVLRATRDFTTHRRGCEKLTAMNCACGFDLHGAIYAHAMVQAEAALKEEA